jgi:hypothetical protein
VETVVTRTVAAAAVLAGVLTLAGCGLDHGDVTGKRFKPSEPYTTFVCMPIGSNPCAMQAPIVEQTGDCWEIDLRDGTDTGTQCIDQAAWGRVHVGDHWSAS